jgi:UPF0755 protein
MNKTLKGLIPCVIIGAAGGYAYHWLKTGTEPMPKGKPFYVRYAKPAPLDTVLEDLNKRGVVKDPTAFRAYALLKRIPSQIGTGTYQLQPGMGAASIFAELKKPVKQMARIPETNWAQRTANLLEKKYDILQSSEYMALVNNPGQFKDVVSFPLPSTSLEGYLYPDTYDLPPLLGAREVIERQLKTFERKVWDGLDHPKNLHELVILGSLVELETGTEEDRAMIAGVIENRVKRGMRLQIDATILYGMQEWRRLTFADYRNQKHAYNTYLIDGLPPGPICSPSLASIKAAMNPAQHNYLYYVAMPDGTSIYASTYAGHKENIKKRRAALREQEAAQ